MTNLQRAEQYISNCKYSVNGQYRPHYHMTPPVGWMNDPNGLIRFNGKYHLFYQYNPFKTSTGAMCWGHFTSDDLIFYRDEGVAIAPEEEGESIFSGGAVECGGNLVALYTRHLEREGEKREEIYSAFSQDGVRFIKCGRAFDNAELPENISRVDFRDPCPVKIGDKYYVFVGGRDIDLNTGVIVVLGGDSPYKLGYKFTIGPFPELGDMGECPSYCKVDGRDVLLASGCNVPERGNDFKNVNSSVFIVGSIDFGGGAMDVDFIREIDKGDSFYAPQFVSGCDEPVIIGWFETWGKRYPTHELSHGWAGAFTIPRELSIEEGDILQRPVRSLEKYCAPSAGLPRCADISLKFGGRGSVTLAGSNGSVTVGLDGGVWLDTASANNMNGCVRRTNRAYKDCSVRILLDVSGVEVFVDGGREVISSRIYIDGGYNLFTEGEVYNLSVREIGR